MRCLILALLTSIQHEQKITGTGVRTCYSNRRPRQEHDLPRSTRARDHGRPRPWRTRAMKAAAAAAFSPTAPRRTDNDGRVGERRAAGGPRRAVGAVGRSGPQWAASGRAERRSGGGAIHAAALACFWVRARRRARANEEAPWAGPQLHMWSNHQV